MRRSRGMRGVGLLAHIALFVVRHPCCDVIPYGTTRPNLLTPILPQLWHSVLVILGRLNSARKRNHGTLFPHLALAPLPSQPSDPSASAHSLPRYPP